ncbi:hypothetical protein AL051_19105 [Pseudomonas amygdali pv. dendropanacis]|nr:hypothetical protein AL051_19105 [Pseudomonas amygdali pv. dendropanacis]
MRRGASHDSQSFSTKLRLSFPTLRVGMRVSTLCVVKRMRSVQNGMRRGASHDGQSFSTKLRLSFPTLRVGMRVSTLCVVKRTQSVRNGMTTRSVAR